MLIDWKRYWCPRDDGQIRLDESGYLSDPAGPFGATFNPDLVSWDSLHHLPCLVLLGEPGIGKSNSLRAWREQVERSSTIPETAYHWANISGYSEDRLRKRLLESDAIRRWLDGDHLLKLVIDSYDECGIPYLGSILAEELEEWPRARLSIAIACRTAMWPASFEQDLRRLWGDKQVGVYELAPLTFNDVVLAARTGLPNPDLFLQEVARLGLGALAAKPFTLTFLLETFRSTHRLPSSQVDVYEAGFRLLASETSQRRRDNRDTGSYSADERLAIATRIAAALAFANRNAVWNSLEDAWVPEGDVTVADLAGGTERARNDTVAITETAVRETLGTGLFSLRGPNRMGFSHQTYEDYLAARYVRERELDPDQVMSLLVHPSDPEGRIAPRLRAVAAWVAALIPEMLPRIAAADAEVLISSDVQIVDQERRAELVETTIGMFEREDLVLGVFGPYYRFDRFAHSGLAAQLRPWILANGESEGRIAALRFTQHCHVHELWEDVLAVALDTSEPERVRSWALMAAISIIPSERRSLLRAFAFGEAGDDPLDRLKGFALQTLFPDHLTLEETLEAITSPRSGSLSGSYEDFLTDHFPANVRVEDLPAALRWLAERGERMIGWFAISHLADRLMRRAWEHIERDDVRDGLALAAWARMRRDESMWRRPMLEEEKVDPLDDLSRRRRLLAGIVPLLQDPDKEVFYLLHGNVTPVRLDDVPWMVQQAVLDTAHAETWARLVSRVADIEDAVHANSVLEGVERSPALRERYAWAVGALHLDAPATRSMKARYLWDQREIRRRSRRREDPSFTPTGPEIERLLSEAEASPKTSGGEGSRAFWQLLHVLRLQPDGRAGASQFELDIKKFPGWEAGDDHTKRRILSAAREYVRSRSPEPERMLREGRIYWDDAAGYMALRLLSEADSAWIELLERQLWERWIPTMLAVEVLFARGERDLAILTRARLVSPEIFANAFVRAVEAEISLSNRAWGVEALADLLDDASTGQFAAWLPEMLSRPNLFHDIVHPLLQHGSAEALQVAIDALPTPPPQDENSRSVAITSARALLAHAPEHGWPVIWSAIQADDDFAVSVLVSSMDNVAEARSIAELPSDQIANLYLWLAQRSDAAPRVKDSDARPTRLESLESRVLELLAGRASNDAVAALRRLAERLPSRRWLRRTIRRVEGQTLEQNWVAPTPAEVLALDGRMHNRLVRNDAHLASVVLSSLERLQRRLIGPNPPTFALWNHLPTGKWRPKEEERLSDFIADHLRLDLSKHGLIINREVEILARQGGAPGEIPDVIVSATVSGVRENSTKTVSVVMEVKGCWNRKLLTAMETQLVERYVETSGSGAGIYCVGWYVCPQWDPSDGRLRAVPYLSQDELRSTLKAQASDLSDENHKVHAFILDAALP